MPLATIVLVSAFIISPMERSRASLRTPLLSEIEDGDLVFRVGRGIYSEVIRAVSGRNARFSHVGVLSVEPSGVFVLHIEPEEALGLSGRASKEPLDEFLARENAREYGFFHVNNMSRRERERVLDRLESFVHQKVAYDPDFDFGDDERLYCTELVYKAFLAAGVDLLLEALRKGGLLTNDGRRIFTPSDLLQSSRIVPVADNYRRIK